MGFSGRGRVCVVVFCGTIFLLLLVMGARRNSVAVAIAKKHAPSHLKVCETS